MRVRVCIVPSCMGCDGRRLTNSSVQNSMLRGVQRQRRIWQRLCMGCHCCRLPVDNSAEVRQIMHEVEEIMQHVGWLGAVLWM